ncbi:MAG: xanthine dehydrogenase family protein subunit M [Kiloniellales bacterium]
MAAYLERPKTLTEALEIKAARPEALFLAGGATLIAMKNAGLVDPEGLIALEGIEDLRGITQEPDGRIRIGAMTRHRETAASPQLTGSLALVREAAGKIANPPVRNMGTMGGALANADPGADYPAALVAAEAELELIGPDGSRRLPIADFFLDWYETALAEGEILAAIRLPKPEARASTYRKLARVSGDYATASCAVALTADQGLRVAIGACGPAPLRAPEAEADLRGKLHDPAAVAALGAALVALADPVDDVRGSAAYRLRLIPRLLASTLGTLLEREAA